MTRLLRRGGTQRPLRVGLFGILCSGNLGNDGSLDVIIDYLRTRHPDSELGFFCMGPEGATERYGAPATSMQWFESHVGTATGLHALLLKVVGKLLDPFRTVAWVRDYDVVIVPGMGALETTTPVRPWAFPLSLYALCVGAKLFGSKVALVSVGANVMPPGPTRWLFAHATRMAYYRSFRDSVSRDAVRRIGVDVSSDQVYEDVAFALPVPVTGQEPTDAVGIGLMAYRGGNDDRRRADELYQAYLATIKGFVHWLLDAGRPVRLFTGDQEDECVIEEIVADVQAKRPELDSSRLIVERPADLHELMQRFAEVDTVVASRYHNVICSLKLSKPTLSISYAAKHDALMAGMGVAEFSQPARSVSLDRLIDQFTQAELRRDELRYTMLERNRTHALRVEEQFVALSAALFTSSSDAVSRAR